MVEHARPTSRVRCIDRLPHRLHGQGSLRQGCRCSRSLAHRLHACPRHPLDLGACRPRLVRDALHLGRFHVLASSGEVCWFCSHFQNHFAPSAFLCPGLQRCCSAPAGCPCKRRTGRCCLWYRRPGLERVCRRSLHPLPGLRLASGPEHVPPP